MSNEKVGITEFKELLANEALTRRDVGKILATVGVGIVTIPMVNRQALAASALDIFTWSVYAVPGLEKSYTEAFGEPKHSILADVDEAFLKLQAGYRPSVVQPTSSLIPRLLDANLIAPINTTKLSNYGDIFPQLTKLKVMSHDGHVFGVPLSWGNMSVLYRKDLAPEYVEKNTWKILWDKKYSGRLAQRDAMEPVVLQTSLLLGIKDPFSLTDEELDAIKQKLREQRPLLRYYWINQTDVTQAIGAGEVVAAPAWNDAYAKLKKEGIQVGYMQPEEGILTWVDVTCRIKDGAGTEDEALAYIDAVISPEAGKFLIEELGYGSVNKKSYPISNPELLVEFGIDDPEKALGKGLYFEGFQPEVRSKAIRMFEEVKAGM